MRARAVAASLVMLAVVVGALSLGATSHAAAGSAAVGCAPLQDCRHGASAVTGEHGAPGVPLTCVQQAACGGGGALVAGGLVLVAILVGSPGVRALVASRRWRVLAASESIVDRLTAGRLFRPPRFAS